MGQDALVSERKRKRKRGKQRRGLGAAGRGDAYSLMRSCVTVYTVSSAELPSQHAKPGRNRPIGVLPDQVRLALQRRFSATFGDVSARRTEGERHPAPSIRPALHGVLSCMWVEAPDGLCR